MISRKVLIDSKCSAVICAPVFANAEGLSTEVAVDFEEGKKHSSGIQV